MYDEIDRVFAEHRRRTRPLVLLHLVLTTLFGLALLVAVHGALQRYAAHCEAHPTAGVCTAIFGEPAP